MSFIIMWVVIFVICRVCIMRMSVPAKSIVSVIISLVIVLVINLIELLTTGLIGIFL